MLGKLLLLPLLLPLLKLLLLLLLLQRLLLLLPKSLLSRRRKPRQKGNKKRLAGIGGENRKPEIRYITLSREKKKHAVPPKPPGCCKEKREKKEGGRGRYILDATISILFFSLKYDYIHHTLTSLYLHFPFSFRCSATKRHDNFM
mmetsp:Transcript_9523/g.17383  ORF Transcript_9523/g.17383 Transcript_9523/m.17383 type:complete len:145 (+) Transcript_9523:2253-2687(+)